VRHPRHRSSGQEKARCRADVGSRLGGWVYLWWRWRSQAAEKAVSVRQKYGGMVGQTTRKPADGAGMGAGTGNTPAGCFSVAGADAGEGCEGGIGVSEGGDPIEEGRDGEAE